MKKFLTYSLIAIAAVYYSVLPLVIAQADDIVGANSASTTVSAGAAPAPKLVTAVLHMRVTAYASVPDETDDTPFITANGTYVHDGVAASNILPFGTRIEIPDLFGDKVFTIEDRMSPRIKNTIDLWMPTVKQAFLFGAEHANILVLTNETSSTGLAVAN